jgi:hypothetical protein
MSFAAHTFFVDEKQSWLASSLADTQEPTRSQTPAPTGVASRAYFEVRARTIIAEMEGHQEAANQGRLAAIQLIEGIRDRSVSREGFNSSAAREAFSILVRVQESLARMRELSEELNENPAAAEMTDAIRRMIKNWRFGELGGSSPSSSETSIGPAGHAGEIRTHSRPSDEELAEQVRAAESDPEALDPETLSLLRQEVRTGVAEGFAPLRQVTAAFESIMKKAIETSDFLEKQRRARSR